MFLRLSYVAARDKDIIKLKMICILSDIVEMLFVTAAVTGGSPKAILGRELSEALWETLLREK